MLRYPSRFFFFFFNDTATTEIYTLSLHDALPICLKKAPTILLISRSLTLPSPTRPVKRFRIDRKSTRLNSSHLGISYAVFCLKKKKKFNIRHVKQEQISRYTIHEMLYSSDHRQE